MTMDLFVARTMITKASLVFRGPIEITESQVDLISISYESEFISVLIQFFANTIFCDFSWSY